MQPDRIYNRLIKAYKKLKSSATHQVSVPDLAKMVGVMPTTLGVYLNRMIVQGVDLPFDIHAGAIYLESVLTEQSNVVVRPISDDELPTVKNWILKKHYIGRWPTGVRYKLGVYYNDTLIGVLLYGPPLRAQSGTDLFKQDGKPIIKNNQVLELLRAYTTDEAKQSIPNLGSLAVSKGNEFIRTQGKSKDGLPIKAILSYADPEVGHSGGVYKATNASYLGQQSPSKVLVVTLPNGNSYEVHPMSLKRYGTDIKKLAELPQFQGAELQWKPVSGKHKYLYPLGKDQRERDALMMHLTTPLYSYPSKTEPSKEIPNPAKAKNIQQPKATSQQEPASRKEILKKLLMSKVKNPQTDRMIKVATALRYDKNHPAHRTARGMVDAWSKKYNIKLI